MAGRAAAAPRAIQQVQPPSVEDATTQRALDTLAAALQNLQARAQRVPVDVDLVVGTNRVQHDLGRAATGYTLTATVADATFAHCIDKSNPNPDREVWIVVVGVAQPGARVEIY